MAIQFDVEEYQRIAPSAISDLDDVAVILKALCDEVWSFGNSTGMPNVITTTDNYITVIEETLAMFASLKEASEELDRQIKAVASATGC